MCLHQKQRKLYIRSLVPLVIVLSVSGFAADGPAAEPQRAVLALYGSRPDLPSNVIVDEIIRSTLERELGPRLDFYAEFLDTARWPEGEAQVAVHEFIRRKYAQRKLSVIIAVARPAINFMRIYGDELFPGVPVVAYGDSDALRDWEPFFTATMDDEDDDTHHGPLLEKPATLNTDPDGLEVGSNTYSINDKALGAGDPIRVREGQRLLIHFLNASAIENRRVALAGHKMKVIALDGNPVPTPQTLDSIFVGGGERIDVVVEMNNPGVWILGSTEKAIRESGLGVVVEYAGQHHQPQWIDPPQAPWDYTIFGTANSSSPAPQKTIELIFEKLPGAAGKFNLWLINGKPYPHEREFVLEQGTRYRLLMRNRTDDAHPMHLHRHLWELAEINGKKTAGIVKDTVVVPYFGRVMVDFTADQPGLALFHCHIQQHMDYGFKALFRYG